MRRTIFYVSDGTGITAETIGHSVLTQFDDIDFDTYRLPFIDDEEKAHGAAARIRDADAITPAIPRRRRGGTRRFRQPRRATSPAIRSSRHRGCAKA